MAAAAGLEHTVKVLSTVLAREHGGGLREGDALARFADVAGYVCVHRTTPLTQQNNSTLSPFPHYPQTNHHQNLQPRVHVDWPVSFNHHGCSSFARAPLSLHFNDVFVPLTQCMLTLRPLDFLPDQPSTPLFPSANLATIMTSSHMHMPPPP